jgi:hypothetical protein
MNTTEILSAIDAEISKLQQARSILGTYTEPSALKRGPGRPKKTATPVAAVSKRVMSAEGKARIAAAQKKRWAAAKKAGK